MGQLTLCALRQGWLTSARPLLTFLVPWYLEEQERLPSYAIGKCGLKLRVRVGRVTQHEVEVAGSSRAVWSLLARAPPL